MKEDWNKVLDHHADNSVVKNYIKYCIEWSSQNWDAPFFYCQIKAL